MDNEDIKVHVAEHHEYNKADAVAKAKDLAAQERPSTAEECGLYFTEIRARYQALVRMVNASLLPKTHEAMGPVETQVALQEKAVLDEEINDKRHRLRLHRLDNPDLQGLANVPLRSMLVLVITLVVFTAQGLWESGAFLVTGETRTRATLIGIGVTIAFALFAHVAVWVIRRLKRRPLKILVGIASLLVAFAGYLVLGTFRARYLAEYLESTEGLELSPVLFALLSLVMFIAVGLLALGLLPSIEEVEEYRARRTRKREEEQMTRELQRLQAEKKGMPRRLADAIQGHAEHVENARALRLHLRELHRECHLAFVQINASRRQSAPPSDLFNEPIDLDLNDQ